MAGMVAMLGTDDGELDSVPVEVLEREIASFAGRLAAATASWLVWIGAFDRRRGWERWEQSSCAGWLNWKCGVDLRTAREHVRVARALEGLPLVRRLFLAGELSYSKVRAITRVADEFNEAELCELAVEATASQLEQTCRGMAERGPLPVWAAMLGFEGRGDHGRMVAEWSIDRWRLVKDVVHAAADQLIEEAQEAMPGEVSRWEAIEALGGMGEVLSAALYGLITGALDPVEGPFEDALLVVDVESLTSDAVGEVPQAEPPPASCGDPHPRSGECTLGGAWVPPVVARRLACDARLQVAVENAVGDAVGLGRESRVVNRRMRRLLMRRDGGMCRFPGCGTRRGLHAHHVVHWADGGETELENLVMVCHFHHRALHEGGWQVMNKNGRFVFYDPDGRESQAERMADPLPGVALPEVVPLWRRGSAEPLAGRGESFEIGFTVANLLANAELRRQRAAEANSS